MAGFLTATVVAGQARDAALSGAATLSVVAFQSYPAPVAFSGDGVLNVSAKPQASLASAATGAGALTGPISPKYDKLLVLAGGGSLTAPAKLQYPLAVNFSGGGALSVNVTAVTLLDFTDTFNRADNVSPGSPWVAAAAPMGDWSISSNMLVNTDAANGDRIFYGPLSKDGQKVTVTMGFNSVGATYALSVFLRTNDDKSAFGGVLIVLVSYDAVTCAISLQMADAAGNPVGTQPFRQDLTFVAGDTFAVASLGDRAVVLKNGAMILTDNDPTHAISTTLNAGERTVMINSEAGYAAAGMLKIDQVRIQEIDTLPTYASLSGGGTLTATVERWLKFVPFNEENTARTNQARPVGTDGAYAMLIGSGGGGGRGHFAAATNRGGGGGGGGAGKVERVWCPVASLGATWTVARPLGGASQVAGAAATFVSGSINLSAGGGGVGGDGTSGAAGAAGSAGTATASGVTATLRNGTTGGAGGAQAGGGGNAGTANATGGAPGGGGGGGLSSIGTRGAGSAGGNSATVSGGVAATTSSPAGKAGTNAAAGNAGGGGGGASIQSTNTNSQIGGAAGVYGAGGGGSSGGNNAYSAGGKGGDSYTLIEWVGTGYYPVPLPVLLDATYTQTTPYAGCSAATFAGMTNGDASGASGQTGTISATGAFIQADLGSVMAIGDIIIGYDYLGNLPGGFGPVYTGGLALQGSNNGSTWTQIAIMPTYASTGSVNGLVPITVNASWRYVRLVHTASGYACATEFAIYGQ